MNDGTVVVLGFGPQQADFFTRASKLCGKSAVLSPDVARMAGASFAIGQQADLDKLHELLAAGAIEAQKRANPNGLSDNAVLWLATGQRGLSSETLFSLATGVDCTDDWGYNHPHDPADLGRCRKLLEFCPELADHLPRVAAAGPEWAALIPRWDELCALMDEESPEWREGRGAAPKTYALMKEIIDGAQQRERN